MGRWNLTAKQEFKKPFVVFFLDEGTRERKKYSTWLSDIEKNAGPNDIVFFATLKAYRLTNQYRMYPRTKDELESQIIFLFQFYKLA